MKSFVSFLYSATRVCSVATFLLCARSPGIGAQPFPSENAISATSDNIDDPNDLGDPNDIEFNDVIENPFPSFPPDLDPDDHELPLPPTNEVTDMLRLLEGPWTDGRKSVVTEFVRHHGMFHDQTWWSTSPSAQSLGHVFRDSWRQWFRSRYELIDENGSKVAEAKQPWGRGNLLSSVKQLIIRDAHNHLLLNAKGILFTKARKQFKLFDANGRHIADAWVDKSQNSVAFSRAEKPHHRIADLVRVSANEKPGRWRLVVREPGVVPAAAWPMLSSFLAHESELFRHTLLTTVGATFLVGLAGAAVNTAAP